MTRNDLPTPALLLDLDRFELNLERLAAHARRAGKHLRPHWMPEDRLSIFHIKRDTTEWPARSLVIPWAWITASDPVAN